MTSELSALPEFKIAFKNGKNVLELPVITTSEVAANICRACFDIDTIEWVESVIVIATNRANRFVGFYKASQGGITGSVVDPRVILQFALLSNASGLILCHNHPSGDLRPSGPDSEVTKKVKTAATYFDIKLLDHIILTKDSYFSFADEGLLGA